MHLKYLFKIINFNFYIKNNAKAKTAAAAALPQKPVVTQPITVVATSKLTSAPCKSVNNRNPLLKSNVNFFLAIVASMTIKPTITVNGPRPTVAAVAAGNINIYYLCIIKLILVL